MRRYRRVGGRKKKKEPERSWRAVGDSRSQQLVNVESRRDQREERKHLEVGVEGGMDGDGARHGRFEGDEGGSAEEGGGPGVPGAPGVTGDLSGRGQARGLRRGPWSHAADRVNDRRHFSLRTRRGKKCQWSRDRCGFRSLRRTRFLPATLSSTKIISSYRCQRNRGVQAQTDYCKRRMEEQRDQERRK